jgi:hypothetical protein
MQSACKLINASILDRLAISMAVICAVHCLVTPLLLVVLPIIATTFWVDEHFHVWMLLLVIPSTGLAMWSGCRRHKDKWVLRLSVAGLSFLISAVLIERMAHGENDLQDSLIINQPEANFESASTGVESHAHGGCCALHPASGGVGETHGAAIFAISWYTLPNVLGGLLLVLGHSRNFILCRRTACSH